MTIMGIGTDAIVEGHTPNDEVGADFVGEGHLAVSIRNGEDIAFIEGNRHEVRRILLDAITELDRAEARHTCERCRTFMDVLGDPDFPLCKACCDYNDGRVVL